jgi:peroxiredoxin
MMSLVRNRRSLGLASLAAAFGLAGALGASAVRAGEEHPNDHAAVGAKAPNFTLVDTNGKTFVLAEALKQPGVKAVVLEWFNPECPFVKKSHQANHTMQETYAKFSDKGVLWVAINSAAPGKEGGGVDRNKKAIADYGIKYPVLIDEKGEVGHAYGAKTTPQMFVIAADGTLIYAGAIDNDNSATKPGSINYVAVALGEFLNGSTVTTSETRSYGCSVKY